MANNMKILVIDDEYDVVKYLSMVLGDEGYEVLTARSGEEAALMLKHITPDLICLDIMMPKESGLKLYVELKKDRNKRDIPIFIVSAVERERDFDLRNYISDTDVPAPEKYIEKPIVVSSFLKAVNEALNNPQGATE